MPRFLRFAVALAATVAVALTGCGDDSAGPMGPGSVASITVTPATANVAVGATQQMVATAMDSQGATVTATISWSSSAADRASGTATITASVGSISGTANVTVTPPPVETVEVTPATGSMTVSQTLQLTASPKDASGNDVAATVTWSTSDAAIVSVDSNGLATAEAAGRATITATADGKTGTSVLDVVAGAFSPTEDMELSGSPRFADIMIPAGVTVTVTSDLDLSSVGDVMLAHSQESAWP